MSDKITISRECAEFFLNMSDGACDIRDYFRYGDELRAALAAQEALKEKTRRTEDKEG